MHLPPPRLPMLFLGSLLGGVSASTTTGGCFLDGLWHGNDPDTAVPVTAGLHSLLGPPQVKDDLVSKQHQHRQRRHDSERLSLEPGLHHHDINVNEEGSEDPPPFGKIEGAAIGCGKVGLLTQCLTDTSGSHGCQAVKSGNVMQCVWIGVQAATEACGAWDDCEGFWCGPAIDIPASNSSWCWARANASLVTYDGHFALDDAYVKSIPYENDAVSATCSSAGCTWVNGVGVWLGTNGSITLKRDNGVMSIGKVDDTCSIITWDNESQWTKLNNNISKVHLVYMAHLDVGYTVMTVKDCLAAYVNEYFPTAWNASETLRQRNGPEKFQWTTHPWLIQALLRNQSGVASVAFIEKLKASIANDDIKYHANPMNMQEEVGEVNHMDFGRTLSAQLDAEFGKQPKIAASQKDAPGVTLGMIDLFAKHGVKMLHVGVNDFSTVPAFPTLSAPYHGYCNPGIYQDSTTPQSSELVLLYCSGYSGPYELGLQLPNMMTLIPGFDEALVYLMHVDNRGPQTAEEALEAWKATQRLFPNAVLEVTSMDEWTENLLKVKSSLQNTALPIIQNVEFGDTWIFGVPSDPTKNRHYRAVARETASQLAAGKVNGNAEDFKTFYNTLLKIPEHTWGYNGADCNTQWSNAQWRNSKFKCVINGDQYTAAANSYLDQREYIQQAISALTGPSAALSADLKQAISIREPLPLSVPPGYTPFKSFGQDVKFGDLGQLIFNESGAIIGLQLNGVQFAGAENPIGLFQYSTYSEKDLNSYGNAYCLRQCASGCGRCSFSKCGLDLSGAFSSRTSALITAAWTHGTNSTYQSFLFNISFTHAYNGELLSLFGAPLYAGLKISIDASRAAEGNVMLNFDLTWYGKSPTRMAEALWMTFAPRKPDTSNWQMDKLGKMIDPMTVVTNGSRTMHAIWEGLGTESGTIHISSPDAPVVTPDIMSLTPTGIFNGTPRPDDGWTFNLFNNAWSTNYPLWSLSPSERFQWSVNLSSH